MRNDTTEDIEVIHATPLGREERQDTVIREAPLTIILNGRELVTLLCTPYDLKDLAIGFLYSEGILREKGELKKIILDKEKNMVWIETKEDKDFEKKLMSKRLITSGCGRGASFYNVLDNTRAKKINSEARLSYDEVLNLVNETEKRSKLFRKTGGAHSASLCDNKRVLILSEDIGRHNAIDKILGKCFFQELKTDDNIIVSSGRISSEILLKVALRNIPIIISRAAPTDLAVRLGEKLGVTLIGFARRKRINIYTGAKRVGGNY